MTNSCITNSYFKQSAVYEYDYGVAVNYLFVLLGITGSIIMIKNREKYFKSHSGFGYLIFLLAVLDLVTECSFLVASLVQSSVFYSLCINLDTSYNTTLTMEYVAGNMIHISDIFLLASGNVGIAVAFIAFAVVCLNGISADIKWKFVGLACIGVSISVYGVCAIFYYSSYKQQIQDPDNFIQPLGTWQYIYYYTYGIYALILVVLFIIFYTCTFYKLQIVKMEYAPAKKLMLNMIQAITISNLVSWIPYIIGNYLYICQTNEMLNPSGFYETDFVYYSSLYLWNCTVYSKGLYHLLALYFSEKIYTQVSTSSIKLDTIEWQTTHDTMGHTTL